MFSAIFPRRMERFAVCSIFAQLARKPRNGTSVSGLIMLFFSEREGGRKMVCGEHSSFLLVC